MTTIMPGSELVRKAIEYIAESGKSGLPVEKLIEEAGMRFNLSPKDCQMLEDFLRTNNSVTTQQK
ncbi:hypothetical protein [Oleidesulfovibrio sp.]|uniref:hypothetical protein n=1 Tax=Oleidesulfovibrio sp. TaxID=2909707 RepID=UPI003A89094E